MLAGLLAVGCGGSLRPAVLLASAFAAYPDCNEVEIAERADGIRQWMVICGERRLFGLRSERELERERAERGLSDDEPLDEVLEDQSPPIAWGGARRVDDLGAPSSPPTSSVSAWLRPLGVEVTMLGVGEESWYLTVDSPDHAGCAPDPEIFVHGERRALGSAPTASVSGSRIRFARRLDLATLRILASEPFEISHCGRRRRLHAETAEVFRAWAAERVAAAPATR